MITRIYFLLVYSGMLLSSCINISESEKRRLDYLKISLENSTKAVSYGIIKTYSEFESKKNDPDYSNQAEKQADHFKVIQTESESINQYIDSLITISGWKGTDLESLFSEKYVTGFLYEKLKRYETVVFKLDSNLKKVFQKSGVVFGVNDSRISPAIFYKTSFDDRSPEGMALSLAMIKNNVKVFENYISTYFINQIGSTIDRFNVFSAIVGQSSNIVKPGDDIEVMAGVGAFSIAAKPQITIGGKSVDIDKDMGTATTKIKASSKPGKHSVPVKVEFINPSGMKEVKVYSIEYTVVDPHNLK